MEQVLCEDHMYYIKSCVCVCICVCVCVCIYIYIYIYKRSEDMTNRSFCNMISDDPDTEAICMRLWFTVFRLLASLLQIDGQKSLLYITPVIVKHWSVVSGKNCTNM